MHIKINKGVVYNSDSVKRLGVSCNNLDHLRWLIAYYVMAETKWHYEYFDGCLSNMLKQLGVYTRVEFVSFFSIEGVRVQGAGKIYTKMLENAFLDMKDKSLDELIKMDSKKDRYVVK